MLRTDTGTFTAVGAAGRHMEGADDVEEVFFEAVGRGLVVGAEVVVIEDALLARACRTDVAAGVAADAAAELILEESELFFRAHGFDLLDLCKAVCVLCVAAFADGLVENLVLLALADMAALQHGGLVGQRPRAVQCLDGQIFGGVRVGRTGNAQDPVKGDLGERQL